jgi:hypothetical protein
MPYGYAIHGGSIAEVITEPITPCTRTMLVRCEDLYGPQAVTVKVHACGPTFPTIEALEAFYDGLLAEED